MLKRAILNSAVALRQLLGKFAWPCADDWAMITYTDIRDMDIGIHPFIICVDMIQQCSACLRYSCCTAYTLVQTKEMVDSQAGWDLKRLIFKSPRRIMLELQSLTFSIIFTKSSNQAYATAEFHCIYPTRVAFEEERFTSTHVHSTLSDSRSARRLVMCAMLL